MQAWKNEILEVLEEKAKEYKEIKFYDVALEMGYTHIKTQEVKEIASKFLKRNPTYKGVRFVKNPKKISSTESLFTTLVLTECEYETEEEFLAGLE